MKGIPADGIKMVQFKETSFWLLTSLPPSLLTELESAARRGRYRTVETLLLNPPQQWEPEIPQSEWSKHTTEETCKRRRAFAPSLRRNSSEPIKAADLEARGLADFRAVFGYEIQARHWRDQFSKILTRDRGAENWDRLEIYLSDKPARKERPVSHALFSDVEFRPLQTLIAGFQDPATPSRADVELLWIHIFELFDELATASSKPKTLKSRLFLFLMKNAPFLTTAKTVGALRGQFTTRRQKENQKDGRTVARPPAFELSTEDRDKIIHHTVFNCGGRLSQAWRELVTRQALSEALLSRLLANPSRKSYVPNFIRESVQPEIDQLLELHKGPRRFKLNGAHISRDWSGVHAMDWWQADDFTMPIYFRAPNGTGGWNLMRGQLLVMIDLRSTRILGFVLISEKNYNARAIRTLIAKCAMVHGLPRKGFYFENGIWRAHILKGKDDPCACSDSEVELGLREFGLKFVHAKLPRAKPIERVGNMLQNLMERLPGYSSRNEITDKNERLELRKRECLSGVRDIAREFLSEEQWENQIARICEEYNSEKQEGKMTGDFSPEKAFEQFDNPADPLIKLDARAHYLLSHHRRPVVVTKRGVNVFGNWYLSDATGSLVGRRVFAWYNPELPEFITITDTNRQNPVMIPRRIEVPAMDDTSPLLAAAQAQVEAHQSPTKVRYRVLESKYQRKFRIMVPNADVNQLGDSIIEGTKVAQRRAAENRTRAAKASKAFARLGMPYAPGVHEEQIRAAENLSEILAQIEALETKGATL